MNTTSVGIICLAAGLALYSGCATSVVPGTISITNPGPAGNTGSGTVVVNWVSSQTSLQGKATWKLKKGGVLTAPSTLGSAKSVPAGAYTIVLSPCSVAGYNAPTSANPVNVADGKQTAVLVQYGH